MTTEERVADIIERFFRESLDAIRYRYNYPDDWRRRLCERIAFHINDAKAEVSPTIDNAEDGR